MFLLLSPTEIAKLMLSATRTEGDENHLQMSNSSFRRMPGIDGMVLICLKLAFDLNRGVIKCRAPALKYILWWEGGRGPHQAANVAIAGICLGATTKREPWGELSLPLRKQQPALPLERTIA